MSDSSLYNELLYMVAIVVKYIQCVTRLIFKSIWCWNSDFKHTGKYNRAMLREFSWKAPALESAILCVK